MKSKLFVQMLINWKILDQWNISDDYSKQQNNGLAYVIYTSGTTGETKRCDDGTLRVVVNRLAMDANT